MTISKKNLKIQYIIRTQPHCPKYPSQQRSLSDDYKKPIILFLVFLLILIPFIHGTNINPEASSDILFGTTIFDWPYSYNETSYVSKFSIKESKVIFSRVLAEGCISASTQDEQGNIYLTGTTETSCYSERNGIFVAKMHANGSTFTMLSKINGSNEDRVEDITLDKQKNIYLTGATYSDDFPVTVDAYQTTMKGYYDAFICKLSADGTEILYSSFLGGTERDSGKSITVNKNQNIYIAGYTESADFPTTENAYDRGHNGRWDIFVTKFSTNGQILKYSTFLGGGNSEGLSNLAMKIDVNNNAYLVGRTESRDYPTTPDALDRKYLGANPDPEYDIRPEHDPSEGFVSKLSVDGSTLIYSTFLGGNSSDRITDFVLVNNSQLYVVGTTTSQDFPSLTNYVDKSNPLKHAYGSDSDVFIVKLNSGGTKLEFSTIIGGNGMEDVSSITLDKRNCIYISGLTTSVNFPVTKDAHDLKYDKEAPYHCEMFFSKFSPDGTTLLYSTYLDIPSVNTVDTYATASKGVTATAIITVSTSFIILVVIRKRK